MSATPVASTAGDSLPVGILIVNPNSSQIMTDAVSQQLAPQVPPGTSLFFHTAPEPSPPSIDNAVLLVQSAAITFQDLNARLLPLEPASSASFTFTDGTMAPHPIRAILVACFSDHPLVGMLRFHFPAQRSMHILEAAVLHALACADSFGVLTTGLDIVGDVDAGVRKVVGDVNSKYKGTVATGVRAIELKTGDPVVVEKKLREGVADLARGGVGAIILGCAGMAGMEGLVQSAFKEATGKDVAVIDGAKAGVQLLAGLARSQYWATN